MPQRSRTAVLHGLAPITSAPGSGCGSTPAHLRGARCCDSDTTSPTTMLWSPAGCTAVVRTSRVASASSSRATPVSGPRWCAIRSSCPCSGRPWVDSHAATGTLAGSQHADAPHAGVEDRVVEPGIDLDADQDQHRVHRDRGDRVGGHGVVVAVAERREHRDPRGEPAHRQPELVGERGSTGCTEVTGHRRAARYAAWSRPRRGPPQPSRTACRRVEQGKPLPAGKSGGDVVGQGVGVAGGRDRHLGACSRSASAWTGTALDRRPRASPARQPRPRAGTPRRGRAGTSRCRAGVLRQPRAVLHAPTTPASARHTGAVGRPRAVSGRPRRSPGGSGCGRGGHSRRARRR